MLALCPSGTIREEVSHQLKGESEMRFVSTALVMMTIALMLLALMLLGPLANSKSLGAKNGSPPNNSQTTGIDLFHYNIASLAKLESLDCLTRFNLIHRG